MSLEKAYGGIFYRRSVEKLSEPHLGIEVDYWYMAKRISENSPIIDLCICTLIFDHRSNRFECKSIHQGNYKTWKEVIRQRLEFHMLKEGVDKLMAKRIARDLEVSKEKMVEFNRSEFLYKKN
ncbi:hypothetical protein MKO06_00685 [Gramella sp. GC03-9]|uniref:Uncharacterized protein n=1 Tax=Christiangramia oceanisediminis TaxID=2920386 RepID=A0A9X2KV79_9FLAO|nr:hypothetical protein [Gramella oceanisediminis]MCP9198405.1 hypothetical protein [Gramella oceanisediminis]